MTEQDEFGKPDPEGLGVLLSAPFVEYRGMLFRKSFFDPALIDLRLRHLTSEEVQRQFNHTHLFLYAADVRVQRQWAHELETFWSSRFETEFPSAKVHVNHEDNGQEVIVTFWKVVDSTDTN